VQEEHRQFILVRAEECPTFSGVGTSGTAAYGEAGVPLLREWFLSFGIIAVRPVIPGPMTGVVFWSLQFDLVWRAEASGAGNAARSRSDRGKSDPEQSFRSLYTHKSCV
jgi:hypothetical protein